MFFAAPAGPAPARGDSESQIGAKNPQNRVCRNSREPEIGICAAFTPKWAVPGMEGEGELWVWPLSPPTQKKTPKLLKIASECAAGRACPQAGNFNKNQGFFHPKTCLVSAFAWCLGRGRCF